MLKKHFKYKVDYIWISRKREITKIYSRDKTRTHEEIENLWKNYIQEKIQVYLDINKIISLQKTGNSQNI